jgi:hypothetical protein
MHTPNNTTQNRVIKQNEEVISEIYFLSEAVCAIIAQTQEVEFGEKHDFIAETHFQNLQAIALTTI